MDVNLLLRGLVLGFAIAAPVGPIGVLCIRRTLSDGRVAGFVSGLGAATADALYGCIAGFGLTLIANALVSYQSWIRLLGGLFLCYLGLKTLASRPVEHAAERNTGSILGTYSSTLFLTLTNPLTILSFAGIFAGLGIKTMSSSYGAATLLVLGVFGGSVLWWSLLVGGVGILRTRLTTRHLLWINRLSGAIIVTFGTVALLGLTRGG